eukprot:1668653-Pyramimonas_sp.AAC.1
MSLINRAVFFLMIICSRVGLSRSKHPPPPPPPMPPPTPPPDTEHGPRHSIRTCRMCHMPGGRPYNTSGGVPLECIRVCPPLAYPSCSSRVLGSNR